jgi:hypothetical protein
MKPLSWRLHLKTIASQLACPAESPYQSSKLGDFVFSDLRTADEFLVRHGSRLRYAKARWLIYSEARWRIDGDGVSIVELFQEFRASLVNELDQVQDERIRRQARRRITQFGSLPMLNRILRIACGRGIVAIPEDFRYV